MNSKDENDSAQAGLFTLEKPVGKPRKIFSRVREYLRTWLSDEDVKNTKK
jgi:hypothetical protein